MKHLLILGILLSFASQAVDRIYDPKNLLRDLDDYLEAPDFDNAFNFKQSTEAMHRQCQFEWRGSDRQWYTRFCSSRETVNYWIDSIKSDDIIVNYRSTQGNNSYTISRKKYERVKGNQIRRILEDTVAYDAEILSLESGKTIINRKEITTNTMNIFYRINTARGYIGFYQRVTISKDIPYISQIVDYSSHDLTVVTNELLDFENQDTSN